MLDVWSERGAPAILLADWCGWERKRRKEVFQQEACHKYINLIFVSWVGPASLPPHIHKAVIDMLSVAVLQIPSFVLHPWTNSALANVWRTFITTFRKTFPLYFSISVVPFVVSTAPSHASHEPQLWLQSEKLLVCSTPQGCMSRSVR